ncbi:MAG: aminotransferase class I/II-fold pyridoxal phosphate-dependent enzyme [Dongiaceae bacterium]
MAADRLEALTSFHPFTRLNGLLSGLKPPAGLAPVLLSVGEPQQTPPPVVTAELQRTSELWGRYPQAPGTGEFRMAVKDWLNRRYRLPAAMIDPDRHILPVAGTREGLFMIALSAVPESGNGKRPAVLMPNPFYHVYAGAAAMAGGEPVFLSSTSANGFQPRPQDVPEDVLARTALAYVCSPANPQGSVASVDLLKAWIMAARRHNFIVAFDECYSEIYGDVAPAGSLEAAALLGGELDHLVVFHSLSKRSGAPGLRSGFICGDAMQVQRMTQLINYGGVAVPGPIIAASTALWRDETHVAAGRARYRANFDAAERILGQRFGAPRPAGGFFLWLDVGDGEEAAKVLWSQAALRVLPGAYMARPDGSGQNPGQRYIRVALVHEPAATAAALQRLADVLMPLADAGEKTSSSPQARVGA